MLLSRYRRILVAVSGMSPQIITETLYGLRMRAEGAWIPDEIHLITTSDGKRNAVLQLLQGTRHFYRFLKDFGINQTIRFDESTIHVIHNSSGTPLADLRTPEDNEAAADCISEKIREFTSDPSTELHVSLAGGRKTMGFYAGYALSLFGRHQDTLSHVLVSNEYESLRDFFYPTPRITVVHNRDNEPLDASQAKVWLAPIPFVRLRSFLPETELVNRARFSEVVQLVAAATGPLTLRIDLNEKSVATGNRKCRLTPALLAFYLWFADRARNQKSGLSAPVEGEFRVDYRDEYMHVLCAIKGISAGTDRTESNTLEKGIDKKFFEQSLSKLNRKLKDAFGPEITSRVGIKKSRENGHSIYAVNLLPQQIQIVE